MSLRPDAKILGVGGNVATPTKAGELETLADRLITRHLRVSIPDFAARSELHRNRSTAFSLEERVRCVAVVGAGASAPLLGRGDSLADDLEKRFDTSPEAHKAELLRLQRVYGLNPRDFETRLAALSRIPEVTEHIRGAISEWYAFRHPTILGYELLAHLLKHRFLDAIISFNFDELLDQSLDDELGANAYRRLVSDRDCVSVVNDADAPDYLPLYIKLHGTASEPDSLRFTREAYYKLPQKLMEEVQALFESHLGVIVNVGSAMTGFDLHRLLRIPQRLEIYDLSRKPISQADCKAITSERIEPPQDSFHMREKRGAPTFFMPAGQLPAGGKNVDCDGWLKRLVHEIDQRSGEHADPKSPASIVRFRSVDRHEAVADVLGPATNLARWIQDPSRYRTDYVSYLRQRTIVELAFSGAKARGLAQLSWLALDRCGTYYELYRREGRKIGQGESWRTLRLAAGLDENRWLPDVVESQPDLCGPRARPTFENGQWALREFVPNALAIHVTNHIGSGGKSPARRLTKALKELQLGSEVEIHATDDQVCSKAFDEAITLPTVTSLRVFTMGLFKDLDPSDEVYISCETGEWLLTDQAMLELLSKQDRVEVITAFDFKSGQLDKLYKGRLALHTIDPWRHNRHMTIVCHGSLPRRAVYFARRLRAPVITPVFLDKPEDAARVKRAYDLMRSEIYAAEATR